MKKALARIFGWGLAALMLAQLVPYGWSHDNPPISREPAWNSPETRALAKRACFDCHSHETRWPWYSNVAPASWLVRYDVDEARAKLNFSAWDKPQKEADEAAEELGEGAMPPKIFLPLHPEARLTEAEKKALVQGFKVTLGERKHESEKKGD